MALLNVIKSNTYSTVSVRSYSKQDHSIQIEVKVYEDNTKKNKIATLNHDLVLKNENTIDCPVLSDPPVSPSLGDRYFVGKDATGDWAGIEGSIVEYQDHGSGGVWHQTTHETMRSSADEINGYWFEDLGGYYAMMDGTNDLVPTGPCGKKLWDTYFNPSLHETSGENLIKHVYNYLKTLPQYVNAVDA